jgi:hypothetical protein
MEAAKTQDVAVEPRGEKYYIGKARGIAELAL